MLHRIKWDYRNPPKSHIIRMNKIRHAHKKYGKQSLSPEDIDEIPGLETLNKGEEIKCIKI
jgi:hypothetical protein|tara:strand:+ start:194 stop:376 length:183 start_codon:yes stop_codon:yes gene_type:complete